MTIAAAETRERRALRDELLAAERELTDRHERVAALRRSLPPGPELTRDHVFREGPRDLANESGDVRETRLSELFSDGSGELIVAHMMFAPGDERGCPMCSMWADGYDGVAHHLEARSDFALIAKADIGTLRDWARRRGWRRIRVLSALDAGFNEDLGLEWEDGAQKPAVSVFTRDGDGTVRHFYTSEASLAPGHHRGIDPFSPVWNLLDLLPSGRGDWLPRHFYD